jgi:hypothetical protein
MNEKQLLAKCQELAAFLLANYREQIYTPHANTVAQSLYFELRNAIYQLNNGVPMAAIRMDAARLGRIGGLARTKAKLLASAENGKKGGRPKKGS